MSEFQFGSLPPVHLLRPAAALACCPYASASAADSQGRAPHRPAAPACASAKPACALQKRWWAKAAAAVLAPQLARPGCALPPNVWARAAAVPTALQLPAGDEERKNSFVFVGFTAPASEARPLQCVQRLQRLTLRLCLAAAHLLPTPAQTAAVQHA